MAGDTRSSRFHYLAWTGVSQGVNAATNLLVTVQLARDLPARDFAAVALALAFLALGFAWIRGYSFEPAVVHGDLSRSSSLRMTRDAAAVGGLIASMILVLQPLVDGPGTVMVIIAGGAAFSLIQDAERWVLIAVDKARSAARLDLVWLTVQALVLLGGARSAVGVASAWACGAVVSAAIGHLLVRSATRPAGSVSRATRVWQWGLEYVVSAGTLQLAIVVAPITGGVEVAGGLRGAASLLGVATVILGIAHQGIAGRLRHVQENAALRALALKVGAVLGTLVALTCIPMLLIGDGVGGELLGDTWPAARTVLPILAIQRVATAIANGPVFVLRRRIGQTTGVWWRASLTAIVLLGVLAAASTGSDRVTAAPLAAGGILSVPIWIRMLCRATDKERQRDSIASHDAERATDSTPAPIHDRPAG